MLEAVKRDLDEISTAVRTEVTNAGSVIGETLKLDEPESTASTGVYHYLCLLLPTSLVKL